MVIAITLAAFILMSAMPSVGTWMRNTRMRSTAESITNGLMHARNEAVRRNQPVGFYLVSDNDAVSMSDTCALSSTSGGWVVAMASPAGKCATDRDAFIALRPTGDNGGGLSIAATDAGGSSATTVTFNGYGQISNVLPITCIRVTNAIDSSVRPLNIAVNAGGQVRMCDPQVTDSNDPRVCQAGCN
ncbi:MAG TPA: GspH/FimT family pseudopilin [Burkholderiaceae bacterium]|nr:GspH/FimT family pseudopilin [Burkholderiaceae bacterium]